MKQPRTSRGARAVGLALLLAAVSAATWVVVPLRLLPEAAAAQRSTPGLLYSDTDQWLSFVPASQPARAGLILYPGGKVPAAAYARPAAAIAAHGYAVFVVPMPLNLAVLGIERAAEVQAAHPDIHPWAVGGHSLGGAMAAEYAARHPGAVHGVLLWAAYSAADLSDLPLRVTTVYGTLDRGQEGFVSAEARSRLPAGAIFLAIQGGNHEQFGDYTGQLNDPPAALPRQEQQAQAVAAAIRLLDMLVR